MPGIKIKGLNLKKLFYGQNLIYPIANGRLFITRLECQYFHHSGKFQLSVWYFANKLVKELSRLNPHVIAPIFGILE